MPRQAGVRCHQRAWEGARHRRSWIVVDYKHIKERPRARSASLRSEATCRMHGRDRNRYAVHACRCARLLRWKPTRDHIADDCGSRPSSGTALRLKKSEAIRYDPGAREDHAAVSDYSAMPGQAIALRLHRSRKSPGIAAAGFQVMWPVWALLRARAVRNVHRSG